MVGGGRGHVVHVHAGAEELGRVYQADILINSGMPEFAAAARKLPSLKPSWSEWTKGARADLEGPQMVQKNTRNRGFPHAALVGAHQNNCWIHRRYSTSEANPPDTLGQKEIPSNRG